MKVNSFLKDISIRDLTDTLGAVKVLAKHRSVCLVLISMYRLG